MFFLTLKMEELYLKSDTLSKSDAKNRIMQQKKLKNYKYKKSNYEEVFILEDYLDEDEVKKLIELL